MDKPIHTMHYILSTSICVTVYIIYKIRNSERYRAFQRLCKLNADILTAYYESYNEIFSDNTLLSTLDDFNEGKPPTRFVVSNDVKPSKYTADCYNILKDLCALGNVKKMYVSKCIDNTVGVIGNQLLHEKEIAENLMVKPNGALLEIGCGCGRISHYVSILTDCNVYGINIDETQLDDARKYAEQTLNNKTQFLLRDLNDTLPFKNETFDGIYTIQGLITWMTDQDKVFKELYRVLKPGAKMVITDAVLLDAFDRNNDKHLELMK
ncbi:unnamed protein product, partial [marine sediment metagenome]